jgi:hypothetical protein
VTEAQKYDLIEKNYTHGPVELMLIVNLANRQATLKTKVFGEVTATATVQDGRPMDKIISEKLPGDVVTLRIEAHKVTITGTLQNQPVAHESSYLDATGSPTIHASKHRRADHKRWLRALMHRPTRPQRKMNAPTWVNSQPLRGRGLNKSVV